MRFSKLYTIAIAAGLLAFSSLTFSADETAASGVQPAIRANEPPNVRLGRRLFADTRFSNAEGDLKNSCRTCHLINEDPRGTRGYTDFLSRSWVPWRREDPRREAGRNSPTIFDSGEMQFLHWDGEFQSLEDLVKGTISTRNLGWLPGEEERAFDQVHAVIMNDNAQGEGAVEAYVAQFKRVYGVDLTLLDRDGVVDWVARAMSDYVRSIKTHRNSAYDEFVAANELEKGPQNNEPPSAFAARHVAAIESLEQTGELKLPPEFGSDALAGLKIFFRTEGEVSRGNCVSCHIPPRFTDDKFHNTGISQSEYDLLHGEGAFADFVIPKVTEAKRPIREFGDKPLRDRPEIIDLGYWNFADLQESPQRLEEETDDAFLDRMIGAFKTPTLRNLGFTQAYFHNGQFDTLDGALGEILRLSELARDGEVRAVDPEFAKVKITHDDLAPIAAFLNALNEHYE